MSAERFTSIDETSDINIAYPERGKVTLFVDPITEQLRAYRGSAPGIVYAFKIDLTSGYLTLIAMLR